jgi:hypothetical protein
VAGPGSAPPDTHLTFGDTMRTSGFPARLSRTIPALALGAAVLAGCAAPVVVAGEAAPATAPAEPARATCEVQVPNLVGMTGEEAGAALAAAGALDVRVAANRAPMVNAVVEQNPRAGTCQQATDAVHLTLEPPAPEPHRQVSSRDWLLIAKSPDAHEGERITVYGQVFQFDAVTGPEGFLARVDGERQRRSYEYDTTVAFSGSAAQLENVVQDDVFRADVTVLGSYSYTTRMGGNTTVPRLQVDAIEVIG